MIWFTEYSSNKIGKFAWLIKDNARTSDPVDGTLVPFGQVWVSPQTGNARIEHPLNFEGGWHVAPQDAWGAVLDLPTVQEALIYSSDTVNVKPILEVTLACDAGAAVRNSIDARLTWNGGTPGSWVNFSTSGHSAGDVYDIALQVGTAVTSSDYYTWKIELNVNYTGDTISR